MTDESEQQDVELPSNGLVWGIVSFVLDVVEILVLVEIIFFDQARTGLHGSFNFLEIYFTVTLIATIGQGIGVVMVAKGWYRSGGIFQIVSSALQVIKIDGIFGVVGGIKAYQLARYLEMQAGEGKLQMAEAT
jgi:hypothetical protein